MAKTSKTNSDNDTTADSGADDIAALRAELAELKAGKATLEAETRNARKQARDATFQTMSAQERAVASEQEACDVRLESLDGQLADIESQIATLTDEGGRGKDVAALTRKMTALSAQQSSEEGRKTYLAAQREKLTGANKQARDGAAEADQGEKLANGVIVSKLDRRSQEWLRKHPKAFTDVRFAKQIVHAAQEAVDVNGLEDNSPEFFEFMDEKFSPAPVAPGADDGEGEEVVLDTRERYEPEKPQPDAAGPGKLAAVVARPTRQTPAAGNGGAGGRKPTLTNDERETALSLYSHMNISDADKLARYAAGKVFMKNRDNKHFASN